MHIHILGISGTFMGGLAVLATELGFQVTGSDQNVYPPMSTQLEKLGVKIYQGYDAKQLDLNPDCIIVGNVMTRGMPVIETILNQNRPMLSGPEWLARFVLHDKHVLAVAGTHGKTTTTSMLAWILESAGLEPGFLIGGVPNNFNISARLGKGHYFVVEADEYDSAFFDKRSKFVHYRPNTLIINNIEFDHADIFKDLAAIQTQFHHLVRTVPSEGLIIYPPHDHNVMTVLEVGCWSRTEAFDLTLTSGWHAKLNSPSGESFEVFYKNERLGTIQWSLIGEHNVLNALAACAAAQNVGVNSQAVIEALCGFSNVKRRLEKKGIRNNITIYDDFAHHPTAIEKTLMGVRARLGESANIIAILDISSNTMKAGVHQEELAKSVWPASSVYFYKNPSITWDVNGVWQRAKKKGGVYDDIERLLEELLSLLKPNDEVIFMSRGSFSGIHQRLLDRL